MEMMKENNGEITFRSKLPYIHIPNHRLPLHSYLFQNIYKYSTHTCLINASTGVTYTYADVELIARKVAAGLHKLGIQKGDVIMLLVQNTPEFVFAFLGAIQIGAICTTTSPFYLKADIEKQAKATNTKLVITQASCIDKVKNLAIKVISIDNAPVGCLHFSELSSANESLVPKVKIYPEDPVAIFFSSGTTGLPKGAVVTHEGLITSVAQQVDGENPNLYFHSKDVIMCVLPLFHFYAFVVLMLNALRAGSAILLMEKFEITAFLELVDKYKATIAHLVPPILLAIANNPVRKYDSSSLRMLISSAAPAGKELEDAVRLKFPNATIGQVYGMTEAGSVMSICSSFAKKPPFQSKPGSCGTIVRNAEMKIVDPNTGISLPRNQAGEICIRGHQIMKEYLNNKRATEETIDKDGWVHSGDIGYIDEDDELFVVDRLKELIKYKGYQIAPAELEAILLSHPHISDAAVVPMKDEVAGEIPVAFIVRRTGFTISEDDVKEYIAKQVVFYKKVHHVFFVDSIPKSQSGKILRKQLREKLARRAKY